MRSIAFGALVGALSLQLFIELPPQLCLLGLPLALLALCIKTLRLPAAVIVGFCWALWSAHTIISATNGHELADHNVVLEGVVVQIPQWHERKIKLQLRVDKIAQSDGIPVATNFLASLIWRWSDHQAKPAVHAGDRWQLHSRLAIPHGLANPGGFDREAWMFEHGIAMTGTVIAGSTNNQLLGRPDWNINRYREHISDFFQHRNLHYPGILAALVVGDRSHINDPQWDVLRSTGTTHLIAISGLHIGLIAGLIFFLVRKCWAYAGTLALWQPAQKVAALAAVIAALLYAGLAGFTIPTQRALIMTTVVLWSLMQNKRRAPSSVLAVAVLAVLVAQPLAVATQSFMLSFTAVAILLFTLGGAGKHRSKWLQAIRLQWMLNVGMLPVVAGIFAGVSLVAPIANIVAVPWIGFLVVPMVLLAGLCTELLPGFSMVLLSCADWMLGIIWQYLLTLSHLPLGYVYVAQRPVWMIVAALVGVVLMIAPRGIPARWLGMCWLAPSVLFTPPQPSFGRFDTTVLDVGQGLAVVVRTMSHALLFDSGPRFGHADSGKDVILPYLRNQGVVQLDLMIISHADMDHIGGAKSVIGGIPVHKIVSSTPDRLPGARHCRRGTQWRWDGVTFRMMHPSDEIPWRGNNRSCVLHIASTQNSLLITGDIEALAEYSLLERYGKDLHSTILVAPHHGSTTSSTKPFVRAVSARVLVVPAGYRNRFGHPHADVIGRYMELGAKIFITGEQGAVRVNWLDSENRLQVVPYRDTHRRFWMPRNRSKNFSKILELP